MFLRSQGVLPRHGRGLQKRSLQRPRANLYLTGAENLKGFEHLAAENESLQVWSLQIPFVIPFSENKHLMENPRVSNLQELVLRRQVLKSLQIFGSGQV